MKKYWKYLVFQVCMSVLLVFVLRTAVDERGGLSDNSDYMDSLWTYTEISPESPFFQNVQLDKDKLKAVEVFVGPDMGGKTLTISVFAGDKMISQGSTLTMNTLYDQWYRVVLNDELKKIGDQNLTLAISCNEQLNLVQVAQTRNLTNEENNVGTVLFYDYKNENRFILVASMIAILLWLAISTILYILRQRLKIHHLFIMLYCLMGLMYLILVPMSGVADEPHHFFRIYEISEGNFVSSLNELGEAGDFLPANIEEGMTQRSTTYAEEREAFSIERSTERAFFEFENTTLYSPISYLPQVIGVVVGKMFTKRLFLIAYFGRCFAFATIGWLLYMSVKYIPVGKEVLMATALLPINLQECMSLAADGLAFAVVTAMISYVLYLRYTYRNQIGVKQLSILIALAVMVASCKIVYLPVCLIVFLVPKEKFGSKASFVWKSMLVCIVAGIVSLMWLIICRKFLPGGDVVNSGTQTWLIMQNPFNYLAVIARTYAKYAVVQFQQLFSGAMGYMDIPCGNDVVLLTAGTYIYILAQSKITICDEKWNLLRIMMGFISLCVIMLTLTSLYLQWTPVGTAWIAGTQGRYYIPILLPMVMALKKPTTQENEKLVYEWPMMIIVNVMALATMVTWYIF